MFQCMACRSEKEASEFHKNRSRKNGIDNYCRECRNSYYVNGRTWPNRKERTLALIREGKHKCGSCREVKTLDAFYISRAIYTGYSAYCRECTSKNGKEAYKKPEAKQRSKDYYSRPDVKKREEERLRASPRRMLSIGLIKALKRRPSKDPVEINDLMRMWHDQSGLCAVSGLRMTWKLGLGRSTGTSISIDRIDNSGDYSKGNVRLICNAVNRFKGDETDDQMFLVALAIVTNMKRPKLRLVS